MYFNLHTCSYQNMRSFIQYFQLKFGRSFSLLVESWTAVNCTVSYIFKVTEAADFAIMTF